MKALFPSWQGNFDGTRPSLAGLSKEHVVAALENGLISDAELKALLHLIRSPDSHFLKVPSLPFHSLISMLSKFPSDLDSRVFYSSTLRDVLFDITYTAVQILMSRNNDKPNSDLLALLLQAAINCQALTGEQITKLAYLMDTSQSFLPRSPASSVSGMSSRPDLHTPDSASLHNTNVFRAPIQAQHNQGLQHGPFDVLAREFGVEAHLVEALAQRLSGFC